MFQFNTILPYFNLSSLQDFFIDYYKEEWVIEDLQLSLKQTVPIDNIITYYDKVNLFIQGFKFKTP